MPHANCPKCGMQIDMPESVEALRVRCPTCRRFFEIPVSMPPETQALAELQAELNRQEKGSSARGRSASIIAAVIIAGALLAAVLAYRAMHRATRTSPQDGPAATASQVPSPKPKPPATTEQKPRSTHMPKPGATPPAGGAPATKPKPATGGYPRQPGFFGT